MMEASELFMQLAPMIETEGGHIAYLRIGKGLMYNKVWCDYVREDTHERVYLHDRFYPTLAEAIVALYNELV